MRRKTSFVEPHAAFRRLKVPKEVVAHSEGVARIADAVAKRVAKRGVEVDFRLVHEGALLHDVGRAETHSLAHGLAGGRMLRGLGFDERVARIAETHMVSGLTAAEAKRSGLPARDFLPETIEEKIVCYADKLSDKGKVGRILAFSGRRSKVAARMRKLFSEMEALGAGGSSFYRGIWGKR